MDEKKLHDLLADRVARRVTRKKPGKASAEDPVARLVARLSKAGRESAVRAGHDPAARKALIADLSAIVAKDPKLKKEITEWAKGKAIRSTGRYRAKAEKKADIGDGGGRLGRVRDIGDGGGEFDRPKRIPR